MTHNPDHESARDALARSEAFKTSDISSYTQNYVDLTVERLPGIDRSAMHLVLLLTRVSRMVSFDVESTAQRPGGLSSPAFYVAAILWLAGPLESSRVAAISGMSRSAVSSLTKTLVRDGWVQRSYSGSDARRVFVSLTEEGEDRIATVVLGVNDREIRWVSALNPEERIQLIALLGKMMTNPPVPPADQLADEPAK